MIRLALAMAVACSSLLTGGCADECEPIRCGLVPPILLTVRDAETGAPVPSARVAVAETPDDWVLEGCETAGPGFDCTHEVIGIGGHDDRLRAAESTEPGYGPWQSEVVLSVDVAITAAGYEPTTLTVAVTTDACGMAEPVHQVVELVPEGSPEEPALSQANAPPTCRESR